MEATTKGDQRRSPSFRLRSSPSLNAVRLRRIFDLFDKNGDGLITVQELTMALNRLGLDTDHAELETTVKSFIQMGNIGLTFEDFDALHKSLDEAFFGTDGEDQSSTANQAEADLSEAFKVFDEDGDGFISADELQSVLRKLDLPEGREIDRVRQMIGSVDRNQDGRVDFFEFKDMMQGVLVLVRSS